MPTKRPSTSLYFSKVLALPGAQAVVAGHLVSEKDEPTATVVLRIADGQWGLVGKIPDIVYAMTLNHSEGHGGAPSFGILGREGYFAVFGAGATEFVDPIVRGHPAYLEGLACNEGIFSACGSQRQVLRHTERGWSRIDEDIYIPFEGSPSGFLLGIAVRSPSELFVCGSEGFAATWNGTRWSRIEIPTNMDLNSVYCSKNGNTYFAGAAGSLFALRVGGQIHDMSNSMVSKNAIYDIVEFQGGLYIATGSELVRVRDDQSELIPVPPSPNGDLAWIYSLSAGESLWCVGDEYVREFDGSSWVVHECPANK